MLSDRFRHILRLSIISIILSQVFAYAQILPLGDISKQRVSGNLSSNGYGWTYKYDIWFNQLEVYSQLRINLTGYTAGSSLVNTWENGSEQTWSLKFDIVDSSLYRYHVNFDTVLGYNLSDAHQTVTVMSGQGDGNMLTWYTTCGWGSSYNGDFAAHEIGHMFGLYDEYAGGATRPSNPVIDNSSIMGSLAGDTKSRHYESTFMSWLQGKAPDRSFTIGAYDPTWHIPEPAAIIFLAGGIIFLKQRLKTGRN